MSASFESLCAIDEALAEEGVPAMSEFWRDTFCRFYGHPMARTLVLRVGRRGGKGLSETKVAINEALFGDLLIPPGEVHRFAFVSVSKDEAGERLRTIADYLRKLGVTFHAKGDEIFLADRPVAFRVCAATIAATSGFTCIGAVIDEGAKWGDYDAADPGDEVLTSVRAMMATHPQARLLLPSSPWGVDDWHARRFDAGDTPSQLVASAPSWVANPTLDEGALRGDMSELHFEREYRAVPGDTDQSAFGSKDVLTAFGRPVVPAAGERWILIDAAKLQSEGGDDFAIAVAAPAQAGGVCLLEVTGCRPGQSMIDAVEKIASLAKTHGAVKVFGDPYESGGLDALLTQRGLILATPPWTVRSKHQAGALVGRLFREGLIALPNHPTMRNQLVTLRARLRPTGLVEYPTNGKDYAALLFAFAHAIDEGLIPASALSLTAMLTDEALDAMAQLPPIGELAHMSTLERLDLDMRASEAEHIAKIEAGLEMWRARHYPPPPEEDDRPISLRGAMRFAAEDRARRERDKK
jgi:hypothetical protein